MLDNKFSISSRV